MEEYIFRILEPDGKGDYRWHKVSYRDVGDANKAARQVGGIVVLPNEVVSLL